MNYPLISEYIEAIKLAEENFDQLNHLCPVLNDDGEPVMSGGNFAVVFKMKDEQTGKLHAVKCFLKEQEGRAEAYRMIAEELEYVNSSFLTPIKYLEKELFVDSKNSEETEFPVLLMDWVEGKTLDKYIREHIDDQYELSLLAYQFSRLAMWLMPQPFAHGDLKPDNILVKKDGTLVLVDYDGMYVPAMKGQKARELGSPDFRHPNRTEDVFDEHIDDFSLASILLSLKAISLQPSLLDKYGASDRLLFSEKDYRDISQCEVLNILYPSMDSELNILLSLFTLALEKMDLSNVSFRLLHLNRPKESDYDNFNTEVTEEDLANAWSDEFGVKYSADKKRLLIAPKDLESYLIREGTKVICNRAFERCKDLSSLTIPMGVLSIGKLAFRFCRRLKSIVIPNSVVLIDNLAFMGCTGLTTLILSENVKCIGNGAFLSAGLINLYIPSKIEKIGNSAFESCFNINKIIVDPNNKFFDSRNNCNAIINSQNNTLVVGCSSTIIPDTVTKIGDQSFFLCKNLKTLSIPDSVREIGFAAFAGCSSLLSVIIPPNVEMIGKSIFNGCQSLTQVDIRGAIKEIPFRTFYNCSALKEISIPKSVITLGDEVFSGCSNLSFISLPNSVKVIDDYAFKDCTNLRSITITGILNKIGRDAFWGCNHIVKIYIPSGTKDNFEEQLAYLDKNLMLEYKEVDSSDSSIENLGKIWEDEYGGIYSQNWKVVYGISSLYKSEYEINDGTETIDNEAFCDLGNEIDYSYLDKIIIPSSVKFIGYAPFNKNLSEIICLSPYFEIENKTLYTKDKKRLIQCYADSEEFHIPDSVEHIDNFAFYGCKSKKIIIPESVNRIGINPFVELNLEEYEIEIISHSEKYEVKNKSLYDNNNLRLISFWGKDDTITINDGIKEIGEYAFFASNLNTINLPGSINSIGDCAFGWCFSLKHVLVPSNSAEKFNKIINNYKDMIRIIE